MNLWRLADCGRLPGPFLTRRVEDNTASSIEDVLRRPLEPAMRRGSTVPPVRMRPEVDWKPAGPGKRSTRQRFEGYDFPADGPGRRDSGPRGGLSPHD